MASACATSSSPFVSAPSACPSSKKTAAAARFRTVSCRATGGGGGGDNDGLLWLPRRDVMLKGLGGVAAGLAWHPGLPAGAAPQCELGKVSEEMLLCADTTTQKPCPHLVRIRKPVHLLDEEYQRKYKHAVKKMRELPESNPLSFKAQAAVHQAYCDSYYRFRPSPSAGDSSEKKAADVPPSFDVHFSWIFAPWHRMYIYFYERALGQLIDDPTFALPYWNWDAPKGMVVPKLFKEEPSENPLYDENRNPDNLDKLVDLDYLKNRKRGTLPFVDGSGNGDYNDRVNENLCTVYRQQQVSGSKNARTFLGEKYCPGLNKDEKKESTGTLESMAHTAMHVWVGKAGPAKCTDAKHGAAMHDGGYSCQNDMGFLGSASNDPLFYSHHSNVDRMWHLWSTMPGDGQGITDPAWLDTSFVFYDNVYSPRQVRMKIRDVLDTRDLGYTYDSENDEALPWLKPKITPLVSHDPKKNENSSPAPTAASTFMFMVTPPPPPPTTPEFPLTLVENKVVEVPGVTLPRNKKGKQLVLVIDGIEFNPQKANKFDVAINVPANKALEVGPQCTEYAGNFAVVPGSGAGEMRRSRACLRITDVLDDINAAGDSAVDVVIVPRTPDPVKLNARPTIQYSE